MTPEKIDITNKHEKYQFTAYIGHVYSEMGLLGEYENAINIIIKDLKATKTRIDVVAYPVLYLMRHSLELGYKSNFEYLSKYSTRQTCKNLFGSHDLEKLHNELREHFDLISTALKIDNELVKEFNQHFELTTKLISQLGSTEISSFRYTKNSKGQRIFQSTDTKDIGEIKELFDKAVTMLVHTPNLISQYTDYKDLLDKLPNFQRGIGTVLMIFPVAQLNVMTKKFDEQYKKIDQLKWKDLIDDQILTVVTIDSDCYLVPIVEKQLKK